MIRFFRFLLFLVLVGWSVGLTAQLFDDNLFKQRSYIEIPFQYTNGFIVVDVIYQGGIPLKFIFDTGSEYTILSHLEIAKLGKAQFEREIDVYGADMETILKAYLIRNNSLSIAKKIDANYLDMLVLEENFLEFDQYVGVPIHGILGANVFSRFVLEINYRRRVIKLINPKASPKIHKSYFEMPLEIISRKPYMQLDVKLDNGDTVAGKFLVDTGAELSLLMLLNTDSLLTLPEKVILTRIGSGLGGNINGYLGRIRSTQIGPFQMDAPIVHFQDFLMPKKKHFVVKNGIIGNRLLSAFHLRIDYPRHKMYLKAVKKKIKEIPTNRSGMTIIASGPNLNVYTISQIAPNSPAEEADFQKGDILKRINGTPTQFMTLTGIYRKLRGKVNKKRSFIIERNNKKIKKTIRLRDLI